MLKELRLKNFKSFAEEQTIPFAPVTVFVGANGSGKSNAFDAVRFLQGFSRELPILDVLTGKTEGGREVHPGIRGGLSEICWNDEAPFELTTTVQVIDDLKYHWVAGVWTDERSPTATESHLDKSPVILEHRVSISVSEKTASVEDEQLFARGSDEKSQRLLLLGAKRNPAPELSIAGLKAIRFDANQFNRTLLQTVVGSVLKDPWRVSAFCDKLATAQFLRFDPELMRNYVPEGKKEVGERGENLSAVVSTICEDTEAQRRFTEWISALCPPPIAEIGFDKTSLGDVLVEVVEDCDRKVSARSLSDGTLRFIGLLAAMFSAPAGSIFLLEEIENGLHPNRIHLLVELFEQFAESRNIQIIATTHSPKVLMSLSEQALRNAVLFARDNEHAGTFVKRLGEIPYFDEVMQKADIDELFSTGWLEFAV